MDLNGLLDSAKNILCLQALVYAFWFNLQQLLNTFLTYEGGRMKIAQFKKFFHYAHIFYIKPINEPVEPTK